MIDKFLLKNHVPKQVTCSPRALALQLLATLLVGAPPVLAVARSSGQELPDRRISVHIKDKSLAQALAEVKRAAKMAIAYPASEVSRVGRVSVDVDSQALGSVLSHLLRGTGLEYKQLGNSIVIYKASPPLGAGQSAPSLAPPVKGTVLDDKGQPLPGATIRVKDSPLGTTTSADGVFLLDKLTPGTVLVISYVGYVSQEVRYEEGTALQVQLRPDPTQLGEAMVTGYQTISQERATGAFDVVDQKLLSRRPVAYLSTALQGLVPGMQGVEDSDGSVSFQIRGTSSLYANKTPLLVVDGFPLAETNFSTINPNDVLSVTVLKDAAAASIWGARSGNGVIVITTKRGQAKKGLQVDFNTFTRVGQRFNLGPALLQASSADQVAYERLAWTNNWVFQPYSGGFSDVYKSLTLAQELLQANKVGTLSDANLNAGLSQLSAVDNRQQIQDYLLQHPVLSQYNLNLQSATDRSNMMVSLLYENNKTAFQGSDYKRYQLNFNNTYQATKFLTLTLGSSLNYRAQNRSGATLDELRNLSPYEVLLNADGSYGTNLADWNREQLAQLPLASFPYRDWSYNLLREVRGRQLTTTDLNLRLQGGLNVRLAKGLSFDSKIQYERRQTNSSDYYSDDTYYVRNLANQLVEYTPATKTVGRAFLPKGGILANPDELAQQSYVFRNQLNYDHTFGQRHEVTAIVGTETSQYRTDTQIDAWRYGYNPDRLATSVPQYGYGTSVAPISDFQGYSASIQGGSDVLGYNLERYASLYANVAYTYNGRYTLSGSARSDASNFITDNNSLRYAPLWSVGGIWNIRQEAFLQNTGFLDRLSLRLTHGRNGNVERSTSTQTLLSIGTSLDGVTGTYTGAIASYGNPTLRWEKTITTNAGLDFAFFGNKLFGKLDVYDKQGKDIVGRIAVPAATGTTVQRYNNTEISNRGIELELGTNLNVGRTGLRYSATLTYAYNRNRVTNLYYPGLLAYQMLDPNSAFVEGRPIGPVYTYEYAGMTGGIPYVVGPGGAPSTFNSPTLHNTGAGLQFLTYQGTQISPHTAGWYNTIGYKQFSVSVLLLGKLGGVYRNPTFNYSATVGDFKTFVNQYVSDVQAGTPGIPGFAKPNETRLYLWDRYAPYLSSLIESASYIECKEITLDYQLPTRWLPGLSGAKLYGQVRDLGLVWAANSKRYNPDWLPGTLRPVTTFTLGLNFQY